MTALATMEIKGPAHFATAAINGDETGFDDLDHDAFDDWWAANIPAGWDVIDVADDAEFSTDCRDWGLPWSGGELVTYTIMRVINP